ncbi:MAG: Gx transporter family protein [Clostridia bacterium]|nr:Gx transporter family protein [Clostridia bacterium]
MKKNTKKIAVLGILTALALIIGFVENMLPPVFAMVPYARLGLSNIIILLVLVIYDIQEGLIVLAIKIVLLAVLSGNPSMIIYSFAGGMLSILTMWLLTFMHKNSLAAISAVGGAMHNIGQVAVAALVTKTAAVFIFLPHLMLFGSLAGILTGVVCHIVVKRVIKPDFLK